MKVLTTSYFDKGFEEIKKKLQQPFNKISKIDDIFKFKQKGKILQFQFHEQILQIVENMSSAVNSEMPAKIMIFLTTWKPS